MDHILQALLESQQPEGIKSALIGRICDEGAKNTQPAATVKGVLQVSCKWILHGTTELQVSSGFKLFHEWGKYNLEVFDSFFNPDSITGMLAAGNGMEANIPLLIREGFRVLSLRVPCVYDDHVQKVREGVTNFIQRATQRIVVRNCVLLFGEFNECIPASSDAVIQLCKAILISLSSGVLPQDGKEVIQYIKQTEEVANFLNILWKLEYHHHLLQDCLNEIFHIISVRNVADNDLEPTIGLASVVRHIDPTLANQAVRDVVADTSVPDEAVERAIGHLIDWLKWPTAYNVAQWLSCFLTELAASGKYTVLISITNRHIDQVIENIAYWQLRSPSFQILSQLLVGFQHSPSPFHKALEKFQSVWKALKDEDSTESTKWTNKLARLVYCLMYQHTGFPDLYDPILELIKSCPKMSDEEMRKELKAAQWSAQVSPSCKLDKSTSVNQCSSSIASSSLGFMSSVRLEKLEPGKTGLDNLGNTCYMNSVIQALYMCDDFRREVLSKPPTVEESLLVKLQYVFASLSLSNRPSVSPNKFMAASRPSWFIPGHQQDCSEFLKFLMDQLHENDKLGQIKKCNSSNSISSHASLKAGYGSNRIPNLEEGVLLTSVKMKSQDDTASADSACLSDKENDTPSSFVEKILRGKVETRLQCLACKTQSKRVETFSDISLAFPNTNTSSVSMSKSPNKSATTSQKLHTLAGGSGDPSPVISTADLTNSNSAAASHNTTATTDKNSCELSLNDLIDFYLKPERLSGDNQYYCDKCEKLQDGEKQICIVESPEYLIFTLLRFSYDIKTQTRTKIFQDVHYPQTLTIPVTRPPYSRGTSREANVSRQHSRSNSLTNIISLKDPKLQAKAEKVLSAANSRHQERFRLPTDRCDLYGLAAVVVHSGNSSDCGHYYCYARHTYQGHPDPYQMDKVNPNESKIDLDNLDLLSNQWYNFNDSRITKTSYQSFSNLTKRFATDTAYVLIYRKLDLFGQAPSSDLPLRSDLRESIAKDNEKYLQEQELEAKSREAEKRRRSASVSSESLKNWKGDKDDDDMSGGGGSHCGGPMGGMDNGPRFVF